MPAGSSQFGAGLKGVSRVPHKPFLAFRQMDRTSCGPPGSVCPGGVDHCGLEELNQKDLEKIKADYEALAQRARDELRCGHCDTDRPELTIREH